MKRTTIIVLLMLCHFTTYGQANKFFRQAVRATDLNQKIDLYSKVIDLEPKNLDAYFYRALAKNDLGDYNGAIVDYSKIIVLKPDADTYYNRGNSRFSLKDLMGAKSDYAKAFELDSNFIDALYSLACVKYDLEDYKGAIEDFSRVIETVPDQPKTYLLRASAYRAIESYKKALKDYTLAVLIDPNANTYYNRGEFFMTINYYQNANNDFSSSLKFNRNNAFAYFYRGASNLLLGKYNNAVSDFYLALKFDATDFDALLGLALTYYKMGDITNAKLNLQKAKSIISPEKDVESVNFFTNTYWFQNQYFYFNNNIKALLKL
ncbi:tetratricopeptide repeat protein [Flavivirga aquimarina]|uniref:Tetratricopeptide repeat protein n=1 Tax=Flavivirga aquimarina TaxID=2027862 RepID=A0ABT8W8V6_9FLAO|nr:tetratricopeptide repeat protein [Flavivirga aquimarina]MDO5969518.1 tetratricopeptide repeat protein [Flavivirga aquimarina]